MSEQRAEVQRIIDNPEPPTFQNTIEALERSGALLNRASRSSTPWSQANTNPTLQQTDVALAPKLAAHRDAMLPEPGALRAHQAHLRRARDARRSRPSSCGWSSATTATTCAPARRSPSADKATLRALNQEQSELTTSFRNKVLADTNAGVAGVRQRRGARRPVGGRHRRGRERRRGARPEGQVGAAAAEHDAAAGADLPKDRAVRERIFKALERAQQRRRERHDADRSRAWRSCGRERAALLGYETHAAFTLDNQMAKTPAAGAEADDRHGAGRHGARAAREAARIQQLIDAQQRRLHAAAVGLAVLRRAGAQGRLRPRRIAGPPLLRARSRAARRRLLRRHQAVRHHASRSARICRSITRTCACSRSSIATAPDSALFYADYFARPAKRGGAWTNSLVSQSRLLGTKTVTTNTCNFTEARAGHAGAAQRSTK